MRGDEGELRGRFYEISTCSTDTSIREVLTANSDFVSNANNTNSFATLLRSSQFADRTAQARRILDGLRKDLHKLKLNYKFHHTLVDRAKVNTDEDDYFDIEGDTKPFSTITEEEQQALEKKIEVWERRMRSIEAEGGDR